MNLAQIKTAIQQPNANVQQTTLDLITQVEGLVTQFNQLHADHVQLAQEFNQVRIAYGRHSHSFWTTDNNCKEMISPSGQVVIVTAPRNQFYTAIGLNPDAKPGSPVTLSRPV